MADRVPITYTFGNHMHWVDMQWLWGYHVLPGSVRDMLHFCRETGAKGNVNFDGIGYEKLACEDPDAFAELRAAVQNGTIEVVGASYGQPYGLFHGGESNVRQRIYGARTVRRLFGKWPKTFWEEEFDFFPQLPQILRGCGFDFASLYFQWTWHTPEVPKEDVPVVWWEGCDGSRLKTATRNRLNLHQWPEDVQILMDELAETGGEADSLILQWLELMPSPDWMCRSEVLLPKTKELLGDERFAVSFATLGEYLDAYKPEPPVRQYTMDDVWHGLTLGRFGDRMRQRSRKVESSITSCEVLASVAGIFGRPYAQWDVYPIWELEEAWRLLLQAQHHDNDECEGLCGHVAYTTYSTAESLCRSVRRAIHQNLGSRIARPEGHDTTLNSLGWVRTDYFGVDIPAFGHATTVRPTPNLKIHRSDDGCVISSGDARFHIATSPHWKTELVIGDLVFEDPLLGFQIGEQLPGDDLALKLARVSESLQKELDEIDGEKRSTNVGIQNSVHLVTKREAPDHMSLIVMPARRRGAFQLRPGAYPASLKPGVNHSVRLRFGNPSANPQIIVDSAYHVGSVSGRNSWPRKYPQGDWMTSPQWFETVQDTFVANSFVDIVDPVTGNGLMVVHDGTRQWFRRDGELQLVLLTNDPWDGEESGKSSDGNVYLIPHGRLSNSQRWKAARELLDQLHVPLSKTTNQGDLPPTFSFASNTPDNVVMTALYRETRDRGYGTDNYAANDFEADYPYIIRLVEFDGEESQVELKINGTVAAAAKTNLLGQHELTLTTELGTGEYGPQSTLRFTMRPKEIATVYFDLVEGRKQTRDLDAKRKIWATVHRTDTTEHTTDKTQ